MRPPASSRIANAGTRRYRGTMIHHEGKKASKGIDELSYAVIGAAIDVHRALGPGLLESAYETCLWRELQHRGVRAERQVALPVTYRASASNAGIDLT
jgi:hypothetical protein